MAKPPMTFEDAISYAIFAINTFMHPDASSAVDIQNLEENSDEVISTLVDIREAVKKP